VDGSGLLYDGAQVGAYLDDPDRVADAVVAAGRAVVGDPFPTTTAAGRPRRTRS
jgi:hypothetical protein